MGTRGAEEGAVVTNNTGDGPVGVKSPRLFVVAGEPSGDIHAANLIRAIRGDRAAAVFAGLGGPQMAEAGCALQRDMMTMSWMGFARALVSAPMVYALQRKTMSFLESYRPDAVVLVDFPGFNLSLARLLAKANIPVIYYISPQIWAWAPGRIEKIRQRVAKMLVIFPFEEALYRKAGVPVEYVGHPLFDELAMVEAGSKSGEMLRMPEGGRVIGLLPGSRAQVVKRSVPVMLKSAAEIRREIPEATFLISCQHERFAEVIGQALRDTDVPVEMVKGPAQGLMKQCELCLVASGTATLELAYYGTPMVVLYRIPPWSYLLGKALLKSRYFSLVNILAGREVVPEMLLWRDDSKRVAGHALALLRNEDTRGKMVAELQKIREMVGGVGASARAAKATLQFVDDRAGRRAGGK